MRHTVRNIDIVARLGGDEFVAIIKNVSSLEDASIVSDKLSTALEKSIAIDGYTIAISASIGISIYPDQASDLNTLLTLSDVAMYRDKSSAH